MASAGRKIDNAWLSRYTVAEAATPQSAAAGAPAETEARAEQDFQEPGRSDREQPIVSRIKGEFDGWDGRTIFQLENGQVWRQRLSGRYRYKGPPGPEVRIERNFFGFFEMRLTEDGRAIGVSRVR